MCGRFTLTVPLEEIIERFDIKQFIDEDLYSPSFNIAPSQMVLSVINDGAKNRLGYFRWGLIPSWAKDEKFGFKMINARAESINEKPSFRKAFKKRRCLVLADSFYEWKRDPNDSKSKTPIRIKLKNNNLFAMAGIWEAWTSFSGEKVYTCSVVTTTANPFMATIHDRMPVILRPEDEQTWINPTSENTDTLNKLLMPLDDDLLEAYEVSNLVNSPKNNSPNLIQPIC